MSAMARKKKEDDIPRLIVPKNATLRQIYKILRESFTAADLQKFTVIEPLIPAEQVMEELEAIHAEETRKRKKK
jgi:hypothetical protein